MVVNQNHIQSMLSQVEQEAKPADLRAHADAFDDYVARGKTYEDAGTGENVSIDSLAEMARILRRAADALEAGEVTDLEDAWELGLTPAPATSGGGGNRAHEGPVSA